MSGKTRGYPYTVCKKRIFSPGKTLGYPYQVRKKFQAPKTITVIFLEKNLLKLKNFFPKCICQHGSYR